MGTGLFGKMPAHGDFVARGIGADLRAALDCWITRNLAGTAGAEDAAEGGGGGWPEGGLRAVLPLAGVAVLALILPGRDRSGRSYPLALLAVPAPQDLRAAERWCDAAAAAMAAGQGGADALARALPGCPAVAAAAAADPLLWTRGAPPAPAAEVLARLFGPVNSG